jgi:hypothetical protein
MRVESEQLTPIGLLPSVDPTGVCNTEKQIAVVASNRRA